jgi:hypothetical protein
VSCYTSAWGDRSVDDLMEEPPGSSLTSASPSPVVPPEANRLKNHLLREEEEVKESEAAVAPLMPRSNGEDDASTSAGREGGKDARSPIMQVCGGLRR